MQRLIPIILAMLFSACESDSVQHDFEAIYLFQQIKKQDGSQGPNEKYASRVMRDAELKLYLETDSIRIYSIKTGRVPSYSYYYKVENDSTLWAANQSDTVTLKLTNNGLILQNHKQKEVYYFTRPFNADQ